MPISATPRRPTGKAIGIDMTDEMLDLARRNTDLANAEFVKGHIGLAIRQGHIGQSGAY